METPPICVDVFPIGKGGEIQLARLVYWRVILAVKKNPGCLGFFGGWKTTQVCGDYFLNHEIRILSLNNQEMESKGPRVFLTMAQLETHWLQNLYPLASSKTLPLAKICSINKPSIGFKGKLHRKNSDTKSLYFWLAFNISSKTISTHNKPLPLDPKTMRNEGFIFEKIWVITSNP